MSYLFPIPSRKAEERRREAADILEVWHDTPDSKKAYIYDPTAFSRLNPIDNRYYVDALTYLGIHAKQLWGFPYLASPNMDGTTVFLGWWRSPRPRNITGIEAIELLAEYLGYSVSDTVRIFGTQASDSLQGVIGSLRLPV